MAKVAQNVDAVRGNRPAASAVTEQMLWSERISLSSNGLQMVSFSTSDGERFSLQPGEELIWIREEEGRERTPFVRRGDETLSFAEYRAEQREQVVRNNYGKFATIDYELAELYQCAVAKAPELSLVRVHLASKEYEQTLEVTGGFFTAPADESGFLDVTISIDGVEHFENLLSRRAGSAEAALGIIGVSLEEAKQSPQILRNFIMLHELGHAVDFMRNYVAHSESFGEAYSKYRAARLKQLKTLPLPGYSPDKLNQIHVSGELDGVMNRYKPYFDQIGLRTAEELLARQDVEYRQLPSEAGPDAFAAMIMQEQAAESQSSH